MKRRVRMTLIVVLAIVIGALWFYLYQNRLPSDGEMIEHFNANRANLEALVAHYRSHTWPVGQGPNWEQDPAAQALMAKTGIDRVSDTIYIWLPDPYTTESAIRLGAMASSGELGRPEFRKNYQLEMSIAKRHRTFTEVNGENAILFKRYVHFPMPPKIGNGFLLLPHNRHGPSPRKYRVLPTLDTYPENFERGDCAVRKLDHQWFISLCRAVIK